MKIPTPHINAKKGDFAKTVLMPGDPNRAKYIAENFLENAKLVNNVRGIQGYTGKYRGKDISVMASGMGVPSMLIYSEELYEGYGVENIIRVGSAGAINEELKIKDLLLIQGASSNGKVLNNFVKDLSISAVCNFELLSKANNLCNNLGYKCKVGNVLSSDFFYDEAPEKMKEIKNLGLHAVEMECAGLYLNAMRFNKKALGICSISDEIYSGKSLNSEEREIGFNNMIKLALELAFAL